VKLWKVSDLFSLKGKTAFITGGLGLIGREILKSLTMPGAKVIILDIIKIREKTVNILEEKVSKSI